MQLLLIAYPHSNGGDYLIIKRIVELLTTYKPYAQIDCYFDHDNVIDPSIINQYSAVITGGGGAQYSEPFIRRSLLYNLIDHIKVPIHYMGTGIYGRSGKEETVYSIQYSEDIKSYFTKVTNNGGQIAARDTVVEAILRNNGIHNVIMTGCPAWYDYRTINLVDIRNNYIQSANDVKKVVVSNHGLTKTQNEHNMKIEQMSSVIQWLKHKYHNAQVILTFNDGIETKYSSYYNKKVQELASMSDVICVDLSYDADRFDEIKEADLHVGFRVHTHLYLLSQRVPSVLIEEDIRGCGMNDVLGLPHVTAYDENMMMEAGTFHPNAYLIRKTDDIVEHMMATRFIDIKTAFIRMKNAFDLGMLKWLQNIK